MSNGGAPGEECIVQHAIWTGTEMVLWCGNIPPHGARYDPKTDTWRVVSLQGAPMYESSMAPVWTGREMVVLGSLAESSGRYDPESDTWHEIPPNRGLAQRTGAALVWDGTGVLEWGGAGTGFVGTEFVFGDGFRYIPPGN